MRARIWCLVMIFFVLIQTGSSALPACCQDVYSNYDETASGELNTNMAVICTNCGSELTTLGNFASLTQIGYGVVGSLSLTCTNCPYLTSFGNFPSLSYVGENDASTDTSTLTITCTSCSSLTSFGIFNVLQTVGGNAYGALNLACTNCFSLVSFAYFPDLASVGTNPQFPTGSASGILTLTCTNCLSLTSFASFPLMEAVGDEGQGTFNITCTNCPSLASFNSFPDLASVGFFSTGALNIMCTNCTSLTSFGNFSLYFIGFAPGQGTLDLICNNCPMLTSLGNFLELSSVGAGVFSASCTDCALPSLGGYTSMSETVTSGLCTGSFSLCSPNGTCIPNHGFCPLCAHMTDPYCPVQIPTVFTGSLISLNDSNVAINPSEIRTCRIVEDSDQDLYAGYPVTINGASVCCRYLGFLSGSTCEIQFCGNTKISSMNYATSDGSICYADSVCYLQGSYDDTAEAIPVYNGTVLSGIYLLPNTGPTSKTVFTKRPSGVVSAAFQITPASSKRRDNTNLAAEYGCSVLGAYTSGPSESCFVGKNCAEDPILVDDYFYDTSGNCYAYCIGST